MGADGAQKTWHRAEGRPRGLAASRIAAIEARYIVGDDRWGGDHRAIVWHIRIG
jgi:hypothetical protein